MVRKIAVITGTRAEYGILKPLLERIASSDKLELQLYVIGLHLLSEYGNTLNEILHDGFTHPNTVKMYNSRYTRGYHAKGLGNGISRFSYEFSKSNPDLLIVFGDRLEPFAATLAAATLNIPIVHIHGGDKTDSGHIDENIRYSISKFAHLHFTATTEHTNRLIRMGEQPWRIHQVGALGLDSIKQGKFLSKSQLSKKLSAHLGEMYIVCLFHPINSQKDLAQRHMHELLTSLLNLSLQLILIYPNNDTGSEKIIEEIENARKLPNITIFKNLEHNDYLNLLKYSSLLIGNSSSGIIEASSFKIPVINVGIRNLGRDSAANTIFINPARDEIHAAIKYVLTDEQFKQTLNQVKNPYGDGRASQRIINILNTIVIDEQFLKKINTY